MFIQRRVFSWVLLLAAMGLPCAWAQETQSRVELPSGLKIDIHGRKLVVQPGSAVVNYVEIPIKQTAGLEIEPCSQVALTLNVHSNAVKDKMEQWHQAVLKCALCDPTHFKERVVPGSAKGFQAAPAVPAGNAAAESALPPNAVNAPALEFADQRIAQLAGLNLAALDREHKNKLSLDVKTMRIDRLVALPSGEVKLVKGTPTALTPVPPATPRGTTAIASIIVGPGEKALKPSDIRAYSEVQTVGTMFYEEQNRAALRRSIELLKSGKPIKIAFVGDSITCGGYVADPNDAFPNRLLARLRAAFPKSVVAFSNLAVSGANIIQSTAAIDLALSAKPDLMIVEFFNDYTAPPDAMKETWKTIVQKAKSAGVEMLVCVPNLPDPSYLHKKTWFEVSESEMPTFLRALAKKESFGIADVAKRWQLMYGTDLEPKLMLVDGIHPNETGHATYADELFAALNSGGTH